MASYAHMPAMIRQGTPIIIGEHAAMARRKRMKRPITLPLRSIQMPSSDVRLRIRFVGRVIVCVLRRWLLVRRLLLSSYNKYRHILVYL